MNLNEHGHAKCEDKNNLSLVEQTNLNHDNEESKYLERVCDSYRQFSTFTRNNRMGTQRRIFNLPETQKSCLPPAMVYGTPEYHEREKAFQDAEIRNQFFLDSILQHAGVPHSQQAVLPQRGDSGTSGWSSDDNISKVSSVLKSVSRDWSGDGSKERGASIQPILSALQKYLPIVNTNQTFPNHISSGKAIKTNSIPRICVPGAGLGRLALEICSMGYTVQGNEISMHMLLASDFILNGGLSPNRPFAISPWLTETRNILGSLDPVRHIYIPDVNPVEMLVSSNENGSLQPDFSMAAGDFVSIYSNPKEHGTWDCVASCFFLDTAPCIVEYLQVIYNMLSDNGLLINFGPLLYHWSGPPYRPDEKDDLTYKSKHSHLDEKYLRSVDMCWEDIRISMLKIGFVFLEEKEKIASNYTSDKTSIMSTKYDCIFFVAKKQTRNI